MCSTRHVLHFGKYIRAIFLIGTAIPQISDPLEGLTISTSRDLSIRTADASMPIWSPSNFIAYHRLTESSFGPGEDPRDPATKHGNRYKCKCSTNGGRGGTTCGAQYRLAGRGRSYAAEESGGRDGSGFASSQGEKSARWTRKCPLTYVRETVSIISLS